MRSTPVWALLGQRLRATAGARSLLMLASSGRIWRDGYPGRGLGRSHRPSLMFGESIEVQVHNCCLGGLRTPHSEKLFGPSALSCQPMAGRWKPSSKSTATTRSRTDGRRPTGPNLLTGDHSARTHSARRLASTSPKRSLVTLAELYRLVVDNPVLGRGSLKTRVGSTVPNRKSPVD
jgi:hypothetical protein